MAIIKYINPFSKYNKIEINVVSGCIGAGKTTYVKQNRKYGELIIDLDYIMRAISYNSAHESEITLLSTAIEIRDYLYDMIELEQTSVCRVWIVTTLQGDKLDGLIEKFNANHIYVNTDKETCINHIMQDHERDDKQHQINLINRYFEREDMYG